MLVWCSLSLKVLGNCQSSSDHFIRCSPFAQYTIFYGGGGAEVARSVRKFWGQKEGGGGMDAGLLFKAGNDLFGRSISGQAKSDLKRDQVCFLLIQSFKK